MHIKLNTTLVTTKHPPDSRKHKKKRKKKREDAEVTWQAESDVKVPERQIHNCDL